MGSEIIRCATSSVGRYNSACEISTFFSLLFVSSAVDALNYSLLFHFTLNRLFGFCALLILFYFSNYCFSVSSCHPSGFQPQSSPLFLFVLYLSIFRQIWCHVPHLCILLSKGRLSLDSLSFFPATYIICSFISANTALIHVGHFSAKILFFWQPSLFH